MATIATVTLAYVAFIPTINATVPNTPEIKLVDVLVYLQILTTILTMVDSLITARTKDVGYIFEWQTNGWFWTTVVISSLVVVTVVVLFIVHKLVWEPVYLSEDKEKKKTLSKKLWYNRKCDKEFIDSWKAQAITVV